MCAVSHVGACVGGLYAAYQDFGETAERVCVLGPGGGETSCPSPAMFQARFDLGWSLATSHWC